MKKFFFLSVVHQPGGAAGLVHGLEHHLEQNVHADLPVIGLVSKLCQELAEKRIKYCHWKSNNALDRSASGDNDLDLLISRADASRFLEILFRLGFKQAKAPADKQMTGVLNYFGYDEQADRWVHVHAHFQLVMGHDMTKNFRLPLEEPYLESAIQGNLFKVPKVEFEFVVFIIRMILKHSTWDAILSREGKLKTSELRELAYLQSRINHQSLGEIIEQYLPFISLGLFNDCVQALRQDCPAWTRIRVGHQLQIRLQSNGSSPLPVDTFLKLFRRMIISFRRRILRSTSKYYPEIGGAIIAITGGDGAGKSTALDSIYNWLSKNYKTTKVHMGKPDWSWTTIAIRIILKIGQLLHLYPLEASFDATIRQKSLVSPGYPYLLREVCRARDRYWSYVKAKRFAVRGGFVLFDRFPLSQIQLMDGPQAERFIHELQNGPQATQFLSPHLTSRFARYLVNLEKNYYYEIVLPELVAVLRVDPTIAVQRKTDEDAASVEERSAEIWNLDWDGTKVHVIDASKSKADVVSELKKLIWSIL